MLEKHKNGHILVQTHMTEHGMIVITGDPCAKLEINYSKLLKCHHKEMVQRFGKALNSTKSCWRETYSDDSTATFEAII